MNRRQFIYSGRLLLLAGLATVSGIAIFKNKNADENKCELDNLCENCRELKECSLPQAGSFKAKE